MGTGIRSKLVPALLFALLVASCPSAVADGLVFSTVAPSVNIPDQSALICFDGTHERLAIETTFVGDGTDFAWVVPLPAVPRVEKASEGLFPTLRLLFRPRVINWVNIGDLFPSLLVLTAATVWMAFAARRSALCVALLLIGWAIAGPYLLASQTLGGVAESALTPAETPRVVIHERSRVGSYEVTTLSVRDAKALLDWLKSNGYKAPPAIEPVVRHYVSEGWCFVAAKLVRSHEAPAEARTRPLVFTFATDTAVYPLRLTGLGGASLSLDLYVFSNREAVARPLTRRQTGFASRLPDDYLHYIQPAFWEESHPDRLPVVHEDLIRLVGELPIGTKLSGTLTAGDMAKDLRLSWKRPLPYRKVLFTRDASTTLSVRIGAWTALLLSVIVCGVFSVWTHRHRKLAIQFRWLALAVLLLALVYSIGNAWPYLFGKSENVIAGVLSLFAGAVACALCGLLPAKPIRTWATSEMYLVGALLWPAWATLKMKNAPLRIVIGAGICALIAAGFYAGKRAATRRRGVSLRVFAWALLGTLTLSVAAWRTALLVTSPRGALLEQDAAPPRFVRSLLKELCDSVIQDIKGKDIDSMPLPEMRRAFQTTIVKSGGRFRNPFTGRPMRHENSPGNYTIEDTDGHRAAYVYDINGYKKGPTRIAPDIGSPRR